MLDRPMSRIVGVMVASGRRGATLYCALVAAHVFCCAPLVRSQSPELIPPNETRPAAPANSSPSDAQSLQVEAPPAATSSNSAPDESSEADAAAEPEAPRPSLVEALNKPGDVTFRNTTIEAALFTIGETWKVNIIAGKEVEGSVNGVFKQAPLREILDALLLANGYSYRVVGESLVVQTASVVGSSNPLFRSVSVPIVNGDLTEIVDGAKLLVSETGQVKALPSARSVLIVDYADRVESIASFVAKMDDAAAHATGGTVGRPANQLEVAYFHTQFIPVGNAQQTLLTVLSPLGRIGLMPRENRLLVGDFPANLEMVRKVLERIDRPRPQVRITALIYDLSLKDVEQLGLNWGSNGKGNSIAADGEAAQSLQFETTTLANFPPNAPGGAFTIRSLTRNFDITTVLNLLQNATDARLLADPNVTVVDNEQAEWKSVSEIPYQQITQSELGGQIGTTAFKEAGITLAVLPTIAGDGTIEMIVTPEFSRLAGFTPGESQPIIDTRRATTRVRVANRQTLVIGGLRQRSDTGEFNGIRWLKDVKYVGPLFRSRDTEVRESELVVFIMPEIVAFDELPNGRQSVASETVTCRLDSIPAAEGGGGCGNDACSGNVMAPLPPVEEMLSPLPGQEMELPGAAAPPPSAATGPLRPSYEARFRADDREGLPGAPRQADEPKPAAKKSGWKRMFRS